MRASRFKLNSRAPDTARRVSGRPGYDPFPISPRLLAYSQPAIAGNDDRRAFIPIQFSKSRRAFATSRRHASETLMNLPPKEGVGNAGCPLHPQPRVRFALVKMH